MKVWKKLSAVALALVMVLALCAPAFAGEVTAEDMDGEEGKIGAFDRTATGEGAVNAPVAKKNQVIIYKELTVFNPSATKVKAPTITYNYIIKPGSADKEITDASGVKAKTLAGTVIGTGTDQKPSITQSVGWTTNDEVDASSSGTANKKPITIDFTGVTFERAGVYRYEIDETVETAIGEDTTAYAAAGVVNGDISATRFLDVYVKDNDTTPANKDIYGYVLMDANDAVNNTDAAKTEGFVASGSGSSAKTADQYHTFNLKITKMVAGDNYNMNATNGHKFPFTVTFTNNTVTNNVLPIITKSDNNAEFSSVSAGAITAFNAANPKLGHEGWVLFTGIPMGTSISITEQNDEANTTYAVTTSGADTNIGTAESVTSGQSTTGTISINAQTAGSEADKNVTVTNTMVLISPTGVALRYAPYLAMLGAGVVALPLTLRKREEEI